MCLVFEESPDHCYYNLPIVNEIAMIICNEYNRVGF